MTDKSTKPGRLTLPIERGIDAEVRALVERLGADAVRNSDGTELPEWVDTNTFRQTLIPPQKAGL